VNALDVFPPEINRDDHGKKCGAGILGNRNTHVEIGEKLV
jgi:hypothetical protein